MKRLLHSERQKTLILFLLFVSFCANTWGQSAQRFTLNKTTISLSDLFREVKKQTGLTVFYNNSLLNDKEEIPASFNNVTVDAVLETVLKGKMLSWTYKDQFIILQKKEAENDEKASAQPTSAIAEENKIVAVHGKVTGGDGGPLTGVQVSIKNSNTGTVTDVDGNFTINISSPDDILQFNYVGFTAQEVKPGNKDNLTITMQENQLNEVVVIGYGTVKKKDLTGAVVSLKGEELTRVPVTNVVEALQGKVPGADIVKSNGLAGASPTIRVRGNRSVANPNSSNNVLYIVDGVQGVEVGDINPNDIESVEVLKDASSTAIYGSKGANGVIIITTKKGSSGKPRLSFNTYAGTSKVAGYGQFMTGEEYVAFKREAYRASGIWTGTQDDAKVFNPQQLAAIQNGQYTNWSDQLLHRGYQQNYQMSVAGGTEKTKVYFSGEYFNEKGLLKMDQYKRYAGRLNIDQVINPWINVGTQTQLAYLDNDVRRDPLNQASKTPPIGTPFDSAGNFIVFPLNGTQINPLADEQPYAYDRNTKSIRMNTSIYLDLHPFKGFSIRSTFGAILNTSEAGSYYGANTIDGKGSRSASSVTQNNNRNTTWETVATYKKEVKEHAFTLTGVASNLSYNNTYSYAGGNNQILPSQSFYNLAAANQNIYDGSAYSKYNLISFTGRFNYAYKGKYLLTVTGRNDGSSKNGKWAFFPSAAAGWRIVDENFMKNQKVFSELKLRVSYGRSGNDVIAPYASQTSLKLVPFSWNDAAAANAYNLNTLGNDLNWELTTTKNLGLDFGIIKGRISGSIDYYDAKTTNLISAYTLPLSAGVTTVNRNYGSTRNKGIEIGITSTNIQSKSFKWTTNVTFTRNTEKIIELPNGNVIADDYRNSLITGQPSQIYFDYKKIGIWQSSEEEQAAKYNAIPGDIKIADLNGDGKISSDDRTIIGQRVPKWSGGLNNTFSYKGIDLNILVIGRFGQWISSDYYAKYNRNGNDNGASIDYWTPENATNAYPRPNSTRAMTYITTLTEREASYAKIRNITIGYTFSPQLLARFSVQSLRIYVSGRNLMTFTNLKDFDPEGEGVIDQPLNRLYVGGLNLTF